MFVTSTVYYMYFVWKNLHTIYTQSSKCTYNVENHPNNKPNIMHTLIRSDEMKYFTVVVFSLIFLMNIIQKETFTRCRLIVNIYLFQALNRNWCWQDIIWFRASNWNWYTVIEKLIWFMLLKVSKAENNNACKWTQSYTKSML